MTSALLLAALLSAPINDSTPPVRLWLSSHGDFRPGDRARVYVETAEDGYLVVLRADAEGRVRVLYPVDPGDDNFVRGGKKFEIRWRGVREAFYVEDLPGQGTVVAVWSPDPFQFDAFTRNDHWDYRVLAAKKVADDPEAGLFDIAAQMAGGARLASDVASYSVDVPWRDGFHRAGFWADPWYPGLRASLFFGSPYYGFGFYRPFYYDPFCYDAFWGYDAFACSGYRFGFGAFYRTRIYVRRPFYVGGFGTSRFTIPRDRVRVTPIEPPPRRRVPTAVQPRGRAPDRASGRGERPAVRERPTIRERPTVRARPRAPAPPSRGRGTTRAAPPRSRQP